MGSKKRTGQPYNHTIQYLNSLPRLNHRGFFWNGTLPKHVFQKASVEVASVPLSHVASHFHLLDAKPVGQNLTLPQVLDTSIGDCYTQSSKIRHGIPSGTAPGRVVSLEPTNRTSPEKIYSPILTDAKKTTLVPVALSNSQGSNQSERLLLLNSTAIQQMTILTTDPGVKRLEESQE